MLQGVQHPYEIFIVTGFEEVKNISLEYIIFPNPTTAHIVLKADNLQVKDLSYQLCNIYGEILQNMKLEDDISIVSLESYPYGTYLLKVIEGNVVLKIFKIIKI